MKILIDIPSNYKERIDTDFENLDTGSIGCTACMFAIKEGLSFPDGATNGDVIKTLFKPYKIVTHEYYINVFLTEDDWDNCGDWITFERDWWNAPYKEGEKNADSN